MTPDHITAVVADASAAAIVIGKLLGCEPVAEVTAPGISVRSFRVGDIEMHLTSAAGTGTIADHHRNHGSSYHHLALRVDDLEAELAALANEGFACLGAPVQTAPGLREVFLDPGSTAGLLIQLVERTTAGTYSLDDAAVSRLADQLDTSRQ